MRRAPAGSRSWRNPRSVTCTRLMLALQETPQPVVARCTRSRPRPGCPRSASQGRLHLHSSGHDCAQGGRSLSPLRSLIRVPGCCGWCPDRRCAGCLPGCGTEVGYACPSGLAADVGRVRLVDEIGPALAVADESSEQRRSTRTYCVHVRVVFQHAYAGQQVVDKISDQSMFSGEASHRTGQSWRRLEELAVEPVGTLGDVDVLTEVG